MTKDLMDALRERRSIRRFKPDPVPDRTLGRLLEAATLAPSAGNAQDWFFYVVKNAHLRQELARAAGGQGFLAEAPVVVVVCADLSRAEASYGARGRLLYCLQDTAAATLNLMLAAVAFGLGTCWVGAFDEGEVARIVGAAPGRLRPVVLVPVGYPDEIPGPRGRRALEEVTRVLDEPGRSEGKGGPGSGSKA
ncbi:MAG: nitroreductase family protein [Firmicutes bacterium]|nr:nitroreductase family protein [Bacillota bacterium]